MIDNWSSRTKLNKVQTQSIISNGKLSLLPLVLFQTASDDAFVQIVTAQVDLTRDNSGKRG